MKVLAVFLVLTLSLPGQALSANSGVTRDRTSQNCVSSLMSLLRSVWTSNKPPKVSFTRTQDLAGYFMPSLAIFVRSLERISSGLGRKELVVEAFRHDRKYLIAYVLMLLGMRGLNNTFFTIHIDRYQERTSRLMDPEPQRILVLESMKDSDPLKQWGQQYFEAHYAGVERFDYIHFSNSAELIAQLSAMPSDIRYDRIEFFIHGSKDRFQFEDGEWASDEVLASVEAQSFSLGAEGCDVRFVVCSLIRGGIFSRDDMLFETRWVQAIAPDADLALAASRDIGVGYPDMRGGVAKQRHLLKTVMMHALTIGPLIEFLEHQLLEHNRNYFQSFEDVIEIPLGLPESGQPAD